MSVATREAMDIWSCAGAPLSGVAVSILMLKGLWEEGHHEFGEAAQLLSGALSSSALSTLC